MMVGTDPLMNAFMAVLLTGPLVKRPLARFPVAAREPGTGGRGFEGAPVLVGAGGGGVLAAWAAEVGSTKE